MHAVSKVFLLLLLCYLSACQPPSTYRIAGLFELTTFNETTLKSSRADESILSIATAFQLAIFDINQSYKILPDTKLEYKIFDTEGITTGALSALVDAVDAGAKLVNGPTKSSQATITAVAASVYNVLLASPTASVAALSNRALYPYFIRSVPPDTKQAFAMIEFIHYFYNITNEEKWLNISIISTADDYGVDGAKNLITQGSLASPEIKTSAFQQFLVDSDDVSVEVRELQKSRARIFVAFMAATGFRSVLKEAEIDEIISDYYIWICSDGCSTDDVFDDAGPRNGLAYRHLARGYSGVIRQGGEGELYANYLQRWNSLDPEKFPGAGKTPTPASLLAYDTVLASAYTLSILFNQGIFEPNGAQLYQAAITVNFTGLTGPYLLEANGDRVGDFDVVNMYPNLKLEKTFTFNFTNGLIPVAPTFFHDGTTKVPDLDVKEEFDYWSCHEKRAGNDPTGKTIELEQPDEDDINFIKAHYECDQFIDCQNMSDEDSHCTPSLVVAFIVLGIIAGLMVGAAICFIPFIIVFGWIVPRGRIWVSGTLFLLFITLSSIFGFISIYTWFGKPHPVACNFQLWVFGLSCTALVSSLFAKQVRFWREYEFLPIKSVRNSGLFKWLKNHRELEFLFWFVLASIIPLIFIIIWTAFSTPTAEMVHQDGHDHYLCNTGGLTGPPLGIVYFFIIFGYFEFLLVVCLIISFLVRRVPQPFMDKRLVSLAVFNLIFVSAVIVAIFFILRFISPFAAWLIRTLAILYAFASTLLLQMIPKVIGIFIVDKCKQNTGGKGGPTKKEKGGSFEPSMSGSASNTQFKHLQLLFICK